MRRKQLRDFADEGWLEQRLIALDVDDDCSVVQFDRGGCLRKAIAAGGMVRARHHGVDAVMYRRSDDAIRRHHLRNHVRSHASGRSLQRAGDGTRTRR